MSSAVLSLQATLKRKMESIQQLLPILTLGMTAQASPAETMQAVDSLRAQVEQTAVTVGGAAAHLSRMLGLMEAVMKLQPDGRTGLQLQVKPLLSELELTMVELNEASLEQVRAECTSLHTAVAQSAAAADASKAEIVGAIGGMNSAMASFQESMSYTLEEHGRKLDEIRASQGELQDGQDAVRQHVVDMHEIVAYVAEQLHIDNKREISRMESDLMGARNVRLFEHAVRQLLLEGDALPF